MSDKLTDKWFYERWKELCKMPSEAFKEGVSRNMKDMLSEGQRLFQANSKMSIEIESLRSELAQAKAELGEVGALYHANKVRRVEAQMALAEKDKALGWAVENLTERKRRMNKARDIVYALAALTDKLNFKKIRDELLTLASFECLSYNDITLPASVAQDAEDSRLRDAVVEAAKVAEPILKFWMEAGVNPHGVDNRDTRKAYLAIHIAIAAFEAAKKGKATEGE